MALVRVTLGGKRLGYVRNNKAGSTTIINYLGQLALERETNLPTAAPMFKNFCGDDSYIGREKGFEAYHKELKECEIRIAVYRDPIDKIIGGFYYCQEFKPHLNNLDRFLDNYQHYLKDNYIRIHCQTNTAMLGPDPSHLYPCLEYERDRYQAAYHSLNNWVGKRYRKHDLGNTHHDLSLKNKK